MVFSSTVFLFLFLPVVLIGYFNPIWKSRKFKNVFLLLCSLAFYAWGEPFFVLIMIISLVVNWCIGRMIDKQDKKRNKILFWIAIIYNIGILFVFKYLTFVLSNFNLLLRKDNVTLEIALPIGISFFSFQFYLIFSIYTMARQKFKKTL